MNALSEQAILADAIAGNAQAFSGLLEQHYDVMYRVAFLWSGNQADAEDIAQEACIKVGRAIRSFRSDSQFSTWLYRIVVNTAKDFHRKQKQHVDIDDVSKQLFGAANEPEQQAEYADLWQLVRRLPESQCDAMLLVYAQGLTHGEAAVILDCAEKTVSWYVHEAKKQLNVWMKDHE